MQVPSTGTRPGVARTARVWAPGAARLLREITLIGYLVASAWWSVRLGSDPAWMPGRVSASSSDFWLAAAGAVVILLSRHVSAAASVILAGAMVGAWPVFAVLLAVAVASLLAKPHSARSAAGTLVGSAVAGLGAAIAVTDLDWRVLWTFHGVVCLLCIGLPVLVHQVLGAGRQLVQRLQERAVYLEETQDLAQVTARLQERARITQAMHDQLGHRLTAVTLQVLDLEYALSDSPDLGPGAPETGHTRIIRRGVQDALAELRTILGAFGRTEASADPAASLLELDAPPSGGADLGQLRSEVEQLVELTVGAGIPVRIAWPPGVDDLTVGELARIAVRGAVREALTNVQRHAFGSAVEVRLTLPEQARAGEGHEHPLLAVTVANGSVPARTPRRQLGAGGGLGLAGVSRRALAAGGRCTVGPCAEGGFEVTVVVPRTLPDRPGRWFRVAGVDPAAAFGVGIGRLAIAVVLLLLPGGVLLAQSAVLTLGPQPPLAETPPLGISRAELAGWIEPGGDPVLALALQGLAPPGPRRADCLFSLREIRPGAISAMRYCLIDDRLVSAERIDVAVPAVPEFGG